MKIPCKHVIKKHEEVLIEAFIALLQYFFSTPSLPDYGVYVGIKLRLSAGQDTWDCQWLYIGG